MEAATSILPAVLLLAAGLVALLSSRALRLSPIVGFLAVGIVIGHHGLGWIHEGKTTHLLAELGVVFLLFDIGLHFSLNEAIERRRDIFALGPAQVLLSAAGLCGIAIVSGVPRSSVLVVGTALALSSTAVVARVLSERNVQTCPLGRSATAVLIYQDVAAIFLLVLVSAPVEAGTSSLSAVAAAAAKTIAAICAALALGRYATKPIFRALARTRDDEIFTGAALFVVLATAWSTAALGLSLTLGAFLAGMMIADTPYRHLIQTEARPFRNLLLGFFFMNVGMTIDPGVLLSALPEVLAGVIILLSVKTAATFVAAKLNGWSNSGATQLAFLLAQGSEFALVVFAIPAVAEAIGARETAVLVSAIALTLALTPAWNATGRKLARSLATATPSANPGEGTPSDGEPVIVFGLNPVGRTVMDALTYFSVPAVALEADPDQFLAATADGYHVSFGDIADLRLAETVGTTHARALVLSSPRLELARELTPIVRERYPRLARFVAVPESNQIAAWDALGVHAVTTHGEPPGLELATAVLRRVGIAEPEVAAWIRSLLESVEAQAA